MKHLIIILLLFVTVSAYAQNDGTLKTIKVGGVDTAAMLLPYKLLYPRQAISLVFTTTGSSGAATGTYSNSTGVFTINIPQYSGGGTNYWTASGNDIYNNNSANVGIGTSSPAQKLDVNGQFKVGLANVSQIYPRSDAGQLSIFGSSTPVKGAYILLNSANPSGFSDSGSALINYGDYTAVAPTNSLLRFRYVTNGRAFDNVSANANGGVGVNTNSAHNTLSVEPRKYYTGQASQSGATVTGVGTTWTSDMVGDYFKWPSQTFAADRITAVNSTTSITLALEAPVGNATVSDYEILRVGLQVTPLGRLGIGTATPTQALHVTGQARIDSLLTGSGSDSVIVVNNGTLKKILQSSITGTGTVTSVAALTLGTSGSDLSSSVANSTTTPVITLNVPTASASNRGALSSTDWSTFNNKQAAISILGSTNGGSGINNAGTLTWGSGGTLGTAAYTASTVYRSSTGSTGDLGSWSSSNTPSNISAVATGSILASAGTGTLPVWTATPSITSITVPSIIGNGATTTPITYKVTTGVGSTGADHIFQVGNNGATEAMRVLNSAHVTIGSSISTTLTNNFLLSLKNASNAQGVAAFQNSSTTGFTSNGFFDNSANEKLEIGYGNSGTASPYTSTSYIAITNNDLNFLGGASGVTNLATLKNGGSLGIGTTSPNSSSLLDVTSTTKGFLPPRMTTTQRDAIASPVEGLVIYNLTTHKLNVYTTAWEQVTSL